ncbi:MAG: 30S ribosomal protein S1 [candidate division Zixibacteria bacterium]|nr:30S ribosomal protein S1 [candidate division Zixibacteria bacterium]
MSEETPKPSSDETETTSLPVETAETAQGSSAENGEKPSRAPYTLPKWIDEQELDEQAMQDFASMIRVYDDTMKSITEGEIVSGRVVAIESGDVIIDVGFKSEGAISLSEFTEPDTIHVGDIIEVYLESIEDQEGQLVISKQKADFMKVWDSIREAYDGGEVVNGQVLRRIKGGLVVDLFGVDAFLPGSQVALKQTPNLDQFLSQSLTFKIIKLNKSRRNIVVSRRVVLEEEKEHLKKNIISELEKGQVRKGVVKNITDFGAFVDLGGIDGLLHITDMSWGRIGHPSELVSIGQEITVAILEFDRDRERISLGLKQLEPYPWANVAEQYPVSTVVKGRVVSITDYGAFVELEKGVEGLIHISEMSWTKHITHPSKLVSINDVISAMVLKVDQQNEKISLGMKQTQPDPWKALEEKFPIGTIVMGKVRNLTAFGAFVELEEGIDGLVHISDMSWTKRIKHPSEILKKGDDVRVVVLNIDTDARRISLGIKQVTEDPWISLADVYPVDVETTGKIVRLLERGVVVELPHDVEGFVPISQLGHPNIKRPGDAFKEGEDIPLKVIEFDVKNRRIVLSVKAYFRDRERAEVDEYLQQHPIEATAIGDVATIEGELAGEKLDTGTSE